MILLKITFSLIPFILKVCWCKIWLVLKNEILLHNPWHQIRKFLQSPYTDDHPVLFSFCSSDCVTFLSIISPGCCFSTPTILNSSMWDEYWQTHFYVLIFYYFTNTIYSIQTILFFFIVIFTTFQPMCPWILQVFHVELGSLHGTSNQTLYLIPRGRFF